MTHQAPSAGRPPAHTPHGAAKQLLRRMRSWWHHVGPTRRGDEASPNRASDEMSERVAGSRVRAGIDRQTRPPLSDRMRDGLLAREMNWLSADDITLDRLLTVLREAHFIVQTSAGSKHLQVWDCGLWICVNLDSHRRLLRFSVWWRSRPSTPPVALQRTLLDAQARRSLLRGLTTATNELCAEYALPLEAGLAPAQVVCCLRRVSHEATHFIEPFAARGWIA